MPKEITGPQDSARGKLVDGRYLGYLVTAGNATDNNSARRRLSALFHVPFVYGVVLQILRENLAFCNFVSRKICVWKIYILSSNYLSHSFILSE